MGPAIFFWRTGSTRLFLCLVATRCSAICVPDRPIKPLLLQLFVPIEGYHQRSVGPVKMPCYRQGQNHISVFLHFVSKLTFPIAMHCKTNAGSTHILVALRRGWEKDCCCYVHLALLPEVKSSQVSPNARRRARCKGGGGKEKSIYVHTNDCTICRRLSENVVAAFTWNRNLGKSEAKHPIEPHFSQHFPSYPEL